MSIEECRLITLPKINEKRGNLTFVEAGNHIPFQIKRVYYVYDLLDCAERGGHAHKNLHQFLIPISGSFEIQLNDGFQKRKAFLNRAHIGLYLPPLTWIRFNNFSTGTICVSLASEFYDETDYIRDYDTFLAMVKNSQ